MNVTLTFTYLFDILWNCENTEGVNTVNYKTRVGIIKSPIYFEGYVIS